MTLVQQLQVCAAEVGVGVHGMGWWSHLMAGHPAYEGSWGCPRQAHYLLQLVYV